MMHAGSPAHGSPSGCGLRQQWNDPHATPILLIQPQNDSCQECYGTALRLYDLSPLLINIVIPRSDPSNAAAEPP